MLRSRFAFLALMFASVAIAAGCGGGGSGGSVLPAPSPPSYISFSVPAAGATEQLSYGGYTLSFTLPALATPTPNPSSSSITAVMGAMPPASPAPGVPIPSARSVRFAPGIRHPNAIGVVPVTPLFYLALETNAQFVFASQPSFTVTLPQASVIPPGSQAYMALYNPAPIASPGATAAPQWQVVTQAGTLNAAGTTLTFTGGPSQITFNQTNNFPPPAADLAPYTFALVVIPTSTQPNCANYQNKATPGLTINMTDSSGLQNTVLVLYVLQQGAIGGAISWMDGTGNFGNQNPVPIPASCYSTTLNSGAANNPLTVPPGHAGRIYIVEATPAPIGFPNPFGGHPLGWTPTAQEPYIYDKIEFNSTNGVIDTTQVDFLGLPLEMSAVTGNANATPLPAVMASTCPAPIPTMTPFSGIPTSGATVGVGQCGYAGIFQTIAAGTPPWQAWQGLVHVQTYGSNPNIDFRVDSPQYSLTFNRNVFADASALPASCSQYSTMSAVQTYGYIGCLMELYKATPQLYQTANISGAAASGDNYCVSSDGTANFVATDIGTGTACSSPVPKATSLALPANPFNIPATVFANPVNASGDPAAGQCNIGMVFASSWGLTSIDQATPAPQGTATAGPPAPVVTPIPLLHRAFDTFDAFAMWKGLILEMNYGSAQTQGAHPIETKPPATQFVQGQLFKDPLYSLYAQVLHSYFEGTYTYAIPYDDGFDWYPGYTVVAPGTVSVRINPIPTGSPVQAPAPVPSPQCSAFKPDIGSY